MPPKKRKVNRIFSCRRCQRKRVCYVGTGVSVSVHSTKYGMACIYLPNPLCKECVKYMKNAWESAYAKRPTNNPGASG